MNLVRVLGSLDRTFAWDGRRLYDETRFQESVNDFHELRGAAAWAASISAQDWRIVRDPLGLNKLFWAQNENGMITLAARPRTLIDAGHCFAQIRAIPRGRVIELCPSHPEPVEHSILLSLFRQPAEPPRGIEAIGEQIRSILTRYFSAISSAHPSIPVYVCLSGGLDSSGIAGIAREFFPNLVAVSFDLKRQDHSASDDRIVAQRLAADLRIPLLEATVTEDELFENLDIVLVEAIDWREFNVHTALVNASLAEGIRRSISDRSSVPLVLTGDLANEFLIDYEPEHYQGVDHYALPRVGPIALRASLVRGLDTCHREIGIFSAWNLSVLQPYAAAVDAYLALPADFLTYEDRKQQLSRAIFGKLLPEYVYTRRKVRAQIGSEQGGGVLAACTDRGIDSNWLKRHFAYLHGITNLADLNRFIRAGVYRSAVPSLAGNARGSP